MSEKAHIFTNKWFWLVLLSIVGGIAGMVIAWGTEKDRSKIKIERVSIGGAFGLGISLVVLFVAYVAVHFSRKKLRTANSLK